MDASYKTIWFSLYYDNRQILLLIIVILYHIYSNILFTKYVKFLLCFNKINVIIYLTYAYLNKQIFINGDIDAADLTMFFLYVNFLVSPITKLSNTVETTQNAWSGFERFYNT